MVIHCLIRSVIAYPYRIQMARHRFIKVCFSSPICFLDGAITIPLFIVTSKYTVFAIHNGGHQITVPIGIYHALLIYYRTSFGRQFIPNNRKHLFQFLHLFQFYRSPGITFNATLTFTGIQVAHKLLAKHIQAHNNVVYLNHNYRFILYKLPKCK